MLIVSEQFSKLEIYFFSISTSFHTRLLFELIFLDVLDSEGESEIRQPAPGMT